MYISRLVECTKICRSIQVIEIFKSQVFFFLQRRIIHTAPRNLHTEENEQQRCGMLLTRYKI